MNLRGSAKLSTELARELVENGFEYKNIREIIVNKTPYRGKDIEKFEDVLFNKIEKFSQYLYVVNTETKEEYYYFTVRDLHEDTGLTVGAINGSIYSGYLANSVYKIDRLSFSSKELCKDKRQLFKRRIGKIKMRECCIKSGKYMSNPLMVIDTHTDDIKIYENARMFCEEFNVKSYNLSKYILNNWKVMSRYKIKTYNKEICC